MISRRKLQMRKNELAKRIKKPVDEVLKLMQNEFTDEDFVSEFKKCFPYLWDDILKEYRHYNHKNMNFYGKKPLFFPSPFSFVLYVAFHKLKKARNVSRTVLTDSERNSLRQSLVYAAQKEIDKRVTKIQKKVSLLQNVMPNCSDTLIKNYFQINWKCPENVDERFFILAEIAKYNSKNNVGFLIWVVGHERNDTLREFALHTLQEWNVDGVELHKKRGKKKVGDNIKPHIPDNPTELLESIEQYQKKYNIYYNVFLSHRSTDKELIIKIKDALNKRGYSVYVDWMVDKIALEPSKYNEHTWHVLQQRILESEHFLYVHTKSCIDSKWIPRELAWAKEHGLPMFMSNTDGAIEQEMHKEIEHIDIKTILN